MLLQIMDSTGHREVVVEEDIDLAHELFNEAIKSGQMAYGIKGDTRTQVHSLDDAILEQFEQILFIAAMKGG